MCAECSLCCLKDLASIVRILVLTSTPRAPDNRALWEGLRQYADVDLLYVEKKDQGNLHKLLLPGNVAKYDRVVLDLRFRYVSRQADLLCRVPGLVIYEEDACQEFIATSKWQGKFSAFYRRIPHARIIFTGYRISRAFADMGVNACFLPKGYSATTIYETDGNRLIEFGFIGRLASSAYDDRRIFLERAASELGVQLLRTEPGDDYRNTLNKIRVFVSADLGMNEYMAKNFEAMACGCVLMAHRQGRGEEEALGLIDGTNVLLYDDYENFKDQLVRLRTMPAKTLEGIARRGLELVRGRCEYTGQAKVLYEYLRLPMRMPEQKPAGLLRGLWLRMNPNVAN
jgi:glycosyltransferase involved in cell wall biosynthesis